MTRDEVRDIDRRAIEEYGLPGIVLMENAGRGCAELLLRLGPPDRGRGRVVVCCGKGNNGGDGYVIARHLENAGCRVEVLLFCNPADVAGDAAVNLHVLQAAQTPVGCFGTTVPCAELDRLLEGAEWIVDALLGTGAQGVVREPYRTAIAAINRSGRRVFAVDLPSGLDCDTGAPLGPCVRARETGTFVAPKKGFEVPTAAEYTGRVHVVDIGVPRKLLTSSDLREES
jgi:NAD(P)H-hydrate epimerase